MNRCTSSPLWINTLFICSFCVVQAHPPGILLAHLKIDMFEVFTVQFTNSKVYVHTYCTLKLPSLYTYICSFCPNHQNLINFSLGHRQTTHKFHIVILMTNQLTMTAINRLIFLRERPNWWPDHALAKNTFIIFLLSEKKKNMQV